jgi:hypothetical protein
MAKQNVLLIQPHSDDILFSASKYLFERDNYGEVKILTIEKGNPKRVDEDIQLCELFNVEYLNLGFDIEDDSYYHYYKKHTVFESENCLPVLKERYGKEFLSEIRESLRKLVKKHKKRGFKILVCLGIGHPMHQFIMECVEDLTDLFYRDFPHSYKRKTKVEFENLTRFKLKSSYFDEENHKMKFDVAYQIYKTQRSLLFFEKGYIDKKIAEEFYTLK